MAEGEIESLSLYEVDAAGRITASIPRNLRAIWKGLSLDRQRAIVAATIEWIKVYPQGQAREFDPDAIKMKPRGWE